jgi:hypothetical protein
MCAQCAVYNSAEEYIDEERGYVTVLSLQCSTVNPNQLIVPPNVSS